MLVALTTDADTTPVIEGTGRFAVNLLAHDQRALSERFARTIPPAEKFAGLSFRRGGEGLPLLADTLGSLECDVVQRIPSADHLLLVGTVRRVHFGRDVPPLVFYHSGYAEVEPDARVKLPQPKG